MSTLRKVPTKERIISIALFREEDFKEYSYMGSFEQLEITKWKKKSETKLKEYIWIKIKVRCNEITEWN